MQWTKTLIFFFNDTATTEIYTLSLHDALPISPESSGPRRRSSSSPGPGSASPPRAWSTVYNDPCPFVESFEPLQIDPNGPDVPPHPPLSIRWGEGLNELRELHRILLRRDDSVHARLSGRVPDSP